METNLEDAIDDRFKQFRIFWKTYVIFKNILPKIMKGNR